MPPTKTDIVDSVKDQIGFTRKQLIETIEPSWKSSNRLLNPEKTFLSADLANPVSGTKKNDGEGILPRGMT